MDSGKRLKICVIGLGYVGLPLAVALADEHEVVGFDIDSRRIDELRDGLDRTNEIAHDRLTASTLVLTASADQARGAHVYIVTVPTPVDQAKRPDLHPVLSATRTVAAMLEAGRGTIVVYESTVYPGVTEDHCGPLLESLSGLVRGTDFFLGYSPERINPGDTEHTVNRITKVVAGENEGVTETLAAMYGAITTGGTFKARSIKAAEAAKVIENAQRDINIAFMNEITRVFADIDLSVWDVLDAARTKWNFLPFTPGLVGGHCIGVDPFYLSHLAQELGHEPKVVLSGRSTNDGMGAWVADRIHSRRACRAGSVLVLGFTFKENVPDLRNTGTHSVIERLRWLGHKVTIHDPLADPAEVTHEYGLELDPEALGRTYDVVVSTVSHRAYCEMPDTEVTGLIAPGGLLADMKAIWRGRDLGDIDRWTL